MKAAFLPERGVVRVDGPDAAEWLQGLITNDIAGADHEQACFAALLSPQGKILFDFLIHRRDEAFLLDCRIEQAAALARRLAMYRLRAQVQVVQDNDAGVAAIWDTPARPHPQALRDPRRPGLGWRLVLPQQQLAQSITVNASATDFAAHRIAAGVPEGGLDFGWNDIFPHDADMDELAGIDFRKGCYIGQEVVSRVQHRGTARKRFRLVSFPQLPPRAGEEIMAGDTVIGTVSSLADASGPVIGLALVRIDRLEAAREAGRELTVNGVAVTIGQDCSLST